MVGRKYKNPPIVEALCEFQFVVHDPGDMTIPGIIYERVKEEFPLKQQQLGFGVKVEPKENIFEQKFEMLPPRMQYLREDKTALVQVSPDFLVVNHLKPYPTWEKLKPLILKMFGIYEEIASPTKIKRIGLRYINRLDFDTSTIELTDFFKYYPYVPHELPKDQSSLLCRVEIPYESQRDRLSLTLATVLPEKLNSVSLILDLYYVLIDPEQITKDKIPDWLEQAHSVIENVFENCITDKSRGRFEEVEKE